MKYKSKTKIDFTDLSDMLVIQNFTGFLVDIGLQSAEEATQEADEIISDDFCGQCEVHKDDCECERDQYRYMREYDDGADFED